MNGNAVSAGPVRADDVEVVGYLYPRPLAILVRAVFGQGSFRYSVYGYQQRRFGIRPDPVKA